MSRKILIFYFVLSLFVTTLFVQSILKDAYVLAQDFRPRDGQIVDTRNINGGITIVVRDGPPSVGGFGYQLAAEKCSVKDGTKFRALERVNVVNGEIWYRVEFIETVGAIECPPTPFGGWIIGRFSNGLDVVQLDQASPISSPTPSPTPSPILGKKFTPLNLVKSLSTPSSGDNLKGTFGDNLKNILSTYIFLTLGVFLGFVLISIEKADNKEGFDLNFPPKLRKVWYFRLITILFMVNLFRFTTLEYFGTNKTDNELFNAVVIFITQGVFGSFIGGFILIIIFIKYVSFTE